MTRIDHRQQAVRHSPLPCALVFTLLLCLLCGGPMRSMVSAQGIQVTSARIGCLDIQRAGNLTQVVGQACDGKSSCTYKAPTPNAYQRMGVKAATRTFCTQAMEIVYRCPDGKQKTSFVAGDAWLHAPASLACSSGARSTNVAPRADGPAVDSKATTTMNSSIVSIPSSEWIPLLNRAAAGFAVRINDYDPSNRQPYVCGRDSVPSNCGPAFRAFVREDSYVRYAAPSGMSSVGSFTTRFTPAFAWNNPFLFLLNDMNMSAGRASVDQRNGFLTLVMPFESTGREVVAACHSDVRCGLGSPEGNNKPGAEINNLAIRVPFRVWVDHRGNKTRLRSGLGEITYTADIERAGACKDNAFAVFCDLFAGDIERRVRAGLTQSMNSFVLSKMSLTRVLDQIVSVNVCQLATARGKSCDKLDVVTIDDAGTLWMKFPDHPGRLKHGPKASEGDNR